MVAEVGGNALSVFLGFFAIMNPLANTAVFVGLTASESRQKQRQIAIKSLVLAFVVVAVFCLMGKLIFELFDITLPALRITGGVLVALIGYQMLHGDSARLHQSNDKHRDDDIAVSPLAVPILAGPGTIATAMNYSAVGGLDVLVSIVAFAALCLLTLMCFLSGPRLIGLLGHSGLSIITRLMGLILAVIGVQMLLQGVFSAIEMFGPTAIKSF